MASFKAAQVLGILLACNLQCSDYQIDANPMNSQIAAVTRLFSGYCKHVKRCSVSNSPSKISIRNISTFKRLKIQFKFRHMVIIAYLRGWLVLTMANVGTW